MIDRCCSIAEVAMMLYRRYPQGGRRRSRGCGEVEGKVLRQGKREQESTFLIRSSLLRYLVSVISHRIRCSSRVDNDSTVNRPNILTKISHLLCSRLQATCEKLPALARSIKSSAPTLHCPTVLYYMYSLQWPQFTFSYVVSLMR